MLEPESPDDQLRELRERIYELERQNALLSTAIERAIETDSFDEAKRFLARSVLPLRRHWDRESIIDKAQEWAELYGRSPAALDWNPAQARRYKLDAKAETYFAGDWPPFSTVAYHFGSWNQMIADAGFEPREPGESVSVGRGQVPTDDKFSHLPEWQGWRQVKRLRKQLGLTQHALTKLSGLSHNYVVAIERGEQTNPSVRIVLALARTLGVEPGALVYHGESSE